MNLHSQVVAVESQAQHGFSKGLQFKNGSAFMSCGAAGTCTAPVLQIHYNSKKFSTHKLALEGHAQRQFSKLTKISRWFCAHKSRSYRDIYCASPAKLLYHKMVQHLLVMAIEGTYTARVLQNGYNLKNCSVLTSHGGGGTCTGLWGRPQRCAAGKERKGTNSESFTKGCVTDKESG